MRPSPEPALPLVEDDPSDAGPVRQALGRLAPGPRVHAVRTAAEALVFRRTVTPTGVLLDLPRPDRSGLAFLAGPDGAGDAPAPFWFGAAREPSPEGSF